MGTVTATADVGVLGVGTMGAAACLALARRGISVLGLEAHTIPNERSSHHGKTRMIRLAYHEHPDYVVLLQEAWRMWRALEAETGSDLLRRTGALYLGTENGELLQGAAASARQHDLPHRTLDPDALIQEFSLFRAPKGCFGLFEDQAGFLFAEEAIRVMAKQAVASGARLVEGCRIQSIDFEEDGVVLRNTEDREFRVQRLVVTAGPGTASAQLGLAPAALTVTRQELGWYQVPEDQWEWAGGLPCWALEAQALAPHLEGLFYGFPALPVERQLKAALHLPGSVVDPHAELQSHPEDLEPVDKVVQQLFPSLTGPRAKSAVCRYTNSEDGHFLLDVHPTAPNTTVACGFSGHGFKFAPVIGEVLADLCLEGGSTRPVGFLAAGRSSP